MPNHCHNRVTIYGSGNDTEETREQIAKLKEIFEGESIFTHFIPEPNWPKTPVTLGYEMRYGMTRANVGELPLPDGTFKSTGLRDERWYDWRLQNWDTKWDAYDVTIDDDDPDQLEVSFETAWSPPEAVCHAMRDQYPDLAVSWFYDEPGCEIAGYL
tara:strand:- start:173 stop:643 length:471 start_codon:yes stop_codon:yes gene_type:complete